MKITIPEILPSLNKYAGRLKDKGGMTNVANEQACRIREGLS